MSWLPSLYAITIFLGYRRYGLDSLRASDQMGADCGHQIMATRKAIEVTSGPLGSGVALGWHGNLGTLGYGTFSRSDHLFSLCHRWRWRLMEGSATKR